MKMYVFGNSEIREDSIALRIVPQLKKRFPEVQFILHSSIDEIEPSHTICILDSAIGINEVLLITNIKQLKQSKSSTQHDFDISFQLQFLQKIGKIKKVNIIAIPTNFDEEKAVKKASEIIKLIRPKGRRM